MIHVSNTGFPAGTIIVAAAMHPRYYEFTMSLAQVLAPEGSKELIVRSCDITQNFNDGIKKMTGEWVWFLGDDHSFDKGLLARLLARNVDIVVPITSCKSIPFLPCMMHGPKDLAPGEAYWHENMAVYHWDEVSGQGLLPLPTGDFIGQAGMLMKKHVLDTLGYPWFKCGQLDAGRLQEDLNFCHRVQAAGFTVHIDQDEILGHHTACNVTARRGPDGKWTPALGFGHHVMVLPDAKPKALATPVMEGRAELKWAPLPTE